MLQNIRDNTQGWIAGVIVSLLILSFALWGIHSYFMGAGSSDVVAKVNGIEISKNQLNVAYERLRRQMQMQLGTSQLPVQAESGLKARSLQTLVNYQVLEQSSLAEGYRITSEQIDNFLQSMPEFQVNGEFSIARFQQALNTLLFSAPDFIEMIKATLLIDQPRLGILFTSFAMPSEISDTMALIGQERDIQYLVIPQNYFNQQSLAVSDEKINAYYAQHQDEFKTPEQVSIEYIELSTKDLANKIKPSEEQLKNFYNENSSLFSPPAEWQLDVLTLPISPNATAEDIKKAQAKMDEILKSAKNGADFAELAKKYTLQRENKLSHWQSLSQIPVDLQKGVAALTKQGDISTPISTEKGFVLVKILGYKTPEAPSYSAVKDKVKEAFGRQKAEEQFADIRDKVANLTYEHPDSLQSASKELGMPIQTTGLFTKDKGGNDLTANNKVREVAFSNDVLNLQNNSDVIPIDSSSVIVLRVKSHVPAATIPLATVRKQIEEKLKTLAIDEKLSALTNDIKISLQSGKSLPSQVSQQYHLNWINVGYIGRHSNKIDQAILQKAFEIPSPQNNKKVNYAAIKVATGYAVVGLIASKPGNTVVSKEQYQAFADQIQSSQGTLEYDLYKDSLRQNAKIVLEN